MSIINSLNLECISGQQVWNKDEHQTNFQSVIFTTHLPNISWEKYTFGALLHKTIVYPLLPRWIVFVLYLPPPSQFQPTVRQIGADKGCLLQTWLLWKHHPLLGSEWSNLKEFLLTCLTFVSIKDTCNILFAWWSHFTTMTRIFEFCFLMQTRAFHIYTSLGAPS